MADTDIPSLSYEAVEIKHVVWGGQGGAIFLVKPNSKVLDFQANLLANVAPFVGSGGTAAAFVTDHTEEINQTTMDWVSNYVPNQIGAKYMAHVTVGFDTLEDLKIIEAEPFDAFPVHPDSLAVYHLGNNGTARVELKSWQL